jgi:hypothetical protein
MHKTKEQISRQARWQQKQRAMGLCIACSRPAYRGWRCQRHYELHQLKARLRYAASVRGRYRDVTNKMLRERLKELEAPTKKAAAPLRRKSRKRAS